MAFSKHILRWPMSIDNPRKTVTELPRPEVKKCAKHVFCALRPPWHIRIKNIQTDSALAACAQKLHWPALLTVQKRTISAVRAKYM